MQEANQYSKFVEEEQKTSEDYAKSTRRRWGDVAISEKKRRRGWMEGLLAPGTPRDLLNHLQVRFCEGPMLRRFAQLLLSSEIR